MNTQSKSVVSQDLIVAARQGLIPVRQRARLGGFGNMLRKELVSGGARGRGGCRL